MEQQQQQHMMTREEAETIAAAEGLTLIEANNKSGFKNVTLGPHCSERPPPKNDYDRRRCKWIAPYYQMRTSVGGRSVLVKFASKFEAALAYALSPDGRRAAEMLKQMSKAPMTEAEVLKIAEEEGLELVRSARSATGFKNVARISADKASPQRQFAANSFRQWGSMTQLGAFATATEAALAVARHTRDSLRAREAEERAGEEEAEEEAEEDGGSESRQSSWHAVRRWSSAEIRPDVILQRRGCEDGEYVGKTRSGRACGKRPRGEAGGPSGSSSSTARCCAICIEVLDESASSADGEAWGETPCGHDFHVECLRDWRLQRGGTACPVCRRPLAATGRMFFKLSGEAVGEAEGTRARV